MEQPLYAKRLQKHNLFQHKKNSAVYSLQLILSIIRKCKVVPATYFETHITYISFHLRQRRQKQQLDAFILL